jgi:hypothetical protein
MIEITTNAPQAAQDLADVVRLFFPLEIITDQSHDEGCPMLHHEMKEMEDGWHHYCRWTRGDAFK